MKQQNKILVIRLGALGDFVLCCRAFQSIRKHYKNDRIALLVRQQFASFVKAMPWFDEIIVDTKPAFWNIKEWLKLSKNILKFRGDTDKITVYDFHCKKRQTIQYFLLGGCRGTRWSGAAPFCAYKRGLKGIRNWQDAQRLQLEQTGVKWDESAINLDWLNADIEKFNLPDRITVLIPGSSVGKDHKRWGTDKFAELAIYLLEQSKTVCLVGAASDAEICADIHARVQNRKLINLCGKTSLFELTGVLRKADLVIGGDTGPMQIASVLERKTIALYSSGKIAEWNKPIGTKTRLIHNSNVKNITVQEVIKLI
ncbi:MAG: glycosyltransferase family 9 protein [Alphaproteobacteria bacterium]|nr:glycosyltransferase family 9 protein [Alphaproteobacteria bacterium]MCL2505518.1 glycosyltransferase family 9 protein [Alphaproteobacteria bacterium]